LVWLAATLSGVSAAFALANLDSVRTGWAPLVSLYGRGDAAVGVKELRRLTAAYSTALHHTEIDAPTQEFIDVLLENLEDFDLDDFHEQLPEVHGKARELRVRGDLLGKRYLVRRADDKPLQVSPRGPRNELLAMSGIVRSTPGRGHGDQPTYLLSGRYGLGVGALTWVGATQALAQFVDVLSLGRVGEQVAPTPSAEARAQAAALHAGLPSEDLAIVSLLFDAYPELSRTLSRLGRVENVRTTWANKDYQQISLKLRGQLERFGEHYPALAKHLGRLDDLARVDVQWRDAQGRTLMTARLDSDKLLLELSGYVKGGKLLAARGAQVFDGEPLEYLSADFDKTRLVVNARFKMLGVVVKMKQLVLSNWYEPHESYARMGSALRTVPATIEVEGAALGFLPTRLVDAFIPGNIESIARDFFELTAKGNDKQGLVLDLSFGSTEGAGNGAIDAAIAAEVPDNFMVKIGIGMVNERLLPNDRAIAQAKRFGADLHDAFVRDLAAYAARASGG
jgi:hypothetical protein